MKNRIYDQFDTLASRRKLMRNAKHRFSDEVNNTEETVEYEETLALLNQEIATPARYHAHYFQAQPF